MKQDKIQYVLYAAAGLAFVSLVSTANSQTTVNGSLNSKTSFYGPPLATQTIETGFGNSTAGDGTSSGGSELDAAYGNISNGTLYLFFAGNFENSGNHLNIFIADSQPNGQNTLAATVGAIQGANGLTFPTGFKPTYVVDMNDYQGTMYIDQDNLSKATGGYLGSVPLTGGIGSNQNLGGLAVGLNNTNALGVGGNTGVAADPNAANAVTTGFEVGIPLSLLNVSGGTVQVIAAINGGGDSYLSNQFLPGLPATYGNLGGPSGVNLQTDNSGIVPISLTVPTSINGNWLPAGGGNWSDAVNWSNNVIPNAAGATASFSSAANASSIALNNQYTVGTISFNSAFAYTITPGTNGSLTLNNNGSNATVTIFGGNHTIAAPVILTSNTTVTVATFGDSLTISGNINGSGGLTAIGAGGASPSLILSGSNTYSGGTTVHAGNLTLGSSTALPANSALTLSAEDVPAGVLDLNGYSASLSSITVTTGPLTGSTGATARIINSGTSPITSVLSYNGSNANPTVFSGIIADNNASSGAVTNLVVNSGSLSLTHSNAYAGSTTVKAGTLTLAAASALPAGGNLNIQGGSVVASTLTTKAAVTVGQLTINNGRLDLTNNGLVVQKNSLTGVNGMVKSGYSNGTWNGSTGIVSNAAAADTTHLTALGTILNNTDGSTPLYGAGQPLGTFNGVSPNATDVLVKYTYYGDANLDGIVDGSDYSLADNGFLMHLTGWHNGDFNYDGVVNGSDYTLLDNAFNTQGASLTAEIASPTAEIASTSVPEPTSLALLGLSTAALLGRRRAR